MADIVGYSVRVPAAFDQHQAIKHLLLLQAWNTTPTPALNSPSWSLSAEVFMLILFPILIFLSNRMKSRASLVAAIALAVLLHLWRARAGMTPWTEATYDFGALRALPSFFVGIAVCRLVQHNPHWRMRGEITGLLATTILSLILLDAPQEITVASFPVLVFCAAITDFQAWQDRPVFRLVRRLSELSYGMFLLHTFVGLALVQAMRRVGSSTPALTGALILAGVVATIALAQVVNRVFEVPMRRMLRDLGPPRVPQIVRIAISPVASQMQVASVYFVSLSLAIVLVFGARMAT